MTDISRSGRVRELPVALAEQLENGEVEKLVSLSANRVRAVVVSAERRCQLERELPERD